MPGAIMENGDGTGSYTNHDRDQRSNGIHAGYGMDKGQGRGWERADPEKMTPTSPAPHNGINGTVAESLPGEIFTNPPDLQERINELPPEIAHITQGYMSLSTLLARLSVRTHEDLKAKILQLSQMPTPPSALGTNGSHITSVDDSSPENLAKKLLLLNFAQSTHADWVKALVITNWSRRSEDVSKTIDLKIYLDQQKSLYELAIHEMSEVKRSLPYARVPNPDLKTALQVLSTGKAPWMPELGYIAPPPLTSRDVLDTLENLNTLLSMRLNLQEYDNIPLQFRDYTIKSGRVTFKVPGEFEIDLTIADEDPEKQFWFIDFRFLFAPTIRELPAHLRFYIESRVNAALLTDGLPGCYRLLHEMVLTHKLSAFRRQASDLARARWVENLKVEALNRSVSIQYWLDKYPPKGPKSWVILGVHSGRRKDGRYDPKATSHLSIRWFREGKEVKDPDIQFDTVNISAETLMKTVVAKHTTYIMEATYAKLQTRPLFASNEMALDLTVSADEPSESELKVQVTSQQTVTIVIEPITGNFVISPTSMLTMRAEYGLNSKTIDPASDAHGYIEILRCDIAADEITSHGLSVGWIRIKRPDVKSDDLKQVFPKDTLQVAWFRRAGWRDEWIVAVSLSMGGDRWWLIETVAAPTPNPIKPNAYLPGSKIASFVEIPIRASSPVPTYNFLSTLGIFAAALASHYANLKSLHSRRALHILKGGKASSPITLPAIYLKLSELLPSKNKLTRTGRPWAKDVVMLTFQGLESLPPITQDPSDALLANTPEPNAESPKRVGQEDNFVTITEARMVVAIPAALSILQERVDPDIAFHVRTGTFAFRLRSAVGESVIPALIERAVRIERLVEFVEVVHKHEKSLRCESISLGKIVLLYGSADGPEVGDGSSAVPLEYKAVVNLGAPSNVMSLSFEHGNPHLLIADRLDKVLNGKQGLDGVAHLLPLTLPTLRAIDAIEEAWTPLFDKGEVLVFIRAVEWYTLRYTLPPSSSSPSSRVTTIDIRLQQRKGQPWWFVRRADSRQKEPDAIDALLAPVWDDAAAPYRGMRVNAVAQPAAIAALLRRIDAVLRRFAGTQTPLPRPPQQNRAPVATMGHVGKPARPQKRQQPTPSQSQSQGTSHTQMEVVEID